MKTVTLSANTSWYLFNFRASTIRRLIRDGYHVVCLSPFDNYSDKLVHQLGAKWLPLPMDNMGNNPAKDLSLVFRLWRYYQRLQPVAALHFTIKNNIYGTWAAKLARVPAVNNISGLGTAFIRSGMVLAIVRLLYKSSQPLAFRVFCQNQEDFSQLVNSRLVARGRLELLPGSGVDLVRFHPSLRREQIGPLRFLYAGRMLRDKGINELIDAVNAINANGLQCKLWLCGFSDVENVSSISQRTLACWSKTPGIEWLGPSDSIEEIYSQVDCVVLPSYREGMPKSLLEAGAMGLPVITTNVPGCRSVVEDGVNGLLCEARNSSALRQAMQRMLEMTREERQNMGKEGRLLIARKYDEQRVVEATIDAVAAAASAH
ncbi:MAG: glycosyltransferase family 4 protein [Halioglobus sp.]|nr:glycosyltransferase family 4 protein [Halioglobus sp.]